MNFVSACWPLVCTKIRSCFFSPRPLLDCLLSSCKVAHVFNQCCLSLWGWIFSLFIRGDWERVLKPSFLETPPLRGKTWTKSGRGQVNLETSNKRWAECKSAQGGGEEAPACAGRSLWLLWRREAVNSWQGQGEVQEKDVPLHLIMRIALSFPMPFFIETNFEIKSFILG